MKRLALLFVPLLVFADGEEITEQLFNSWKSTVIQEINNAKSNIRLADNDLAYVQNRYISMSQSAATFTGDYGNGYRAALSEFPIGSVSSARSDLGYAQDKLDNALMYLNRLQFSNASNIDYRVWLDRMTNQLERIADLVDLTDDDVRTNGVYLSSVVQILQSILNSMPSGSGGSGGGGGSDPIDYSDDLDAIISILGSASTTLEAIDSCVYSIYELFAEVDGVYQKFIKLATDRLKIPDQYLAVDLARMWEYTVNNMSNVIVNSSAFSDTDQINPVMNNVSADGTHLSNEGAIMLNQLAFQQRQYLCTVEALNILRGNTNASDVAWITNYLDKVQSGFYTQFNVGNTSPVSWSPFNTTRYNSTTNLLGSVGQNPYWVQHSKWITFHNNHTNWWDRLETYLLVLTGVISSADPLSDDSVETMQDSENIERTNEYSTNSLYSAVAEVASVSNSLSSVVSSFQDFIGSFHFEDTPSASSGYIRIMPDFVLGGIEIPHIDLTYQDIDFLVDGTRTIFTAIWYFVFGALGFKFICMAVFLFGRTVARVSLIIATLLN